LQDREKEVFCSLMRKTEAFCGVRILTYSVLSNHYHILVYVPEREDISDAELISRLRIFYSGPLIDQFAQQLQEARAQGQVERVKALRETYLARMYDLSAFMKLLKQRFSIWYNHQTQRKGTLWEERFKSLLIEGSPGALLGVAAYIDLNPVRAGLVSDPKDYRHCGYGEAMGGQALARSRLFELIALTGGGGTWLQAAAQYRCVLFDVNRKDPKRPGRGFDPERVQQVLDRKGRLTHGELLRCRVRYFTDGVVMGSQTFVESVFQRYQSYFGVKRKDGARPMGFGEWDGLCTIRALRLKVVSPPVPATG
jgi:REP element-mobilizing transposase RayT